MHDLAMEALVEQAKAGSQDACTELFRRILPRLQGLVYKILRKHPEEIEDVLQTAASKIFLHIGSFAGKSSFHTWCARIAINEAVMTLRIIQTHPDRRPDALYYDHGIEVNDESGMMFAPGIVDPNFAKYEARADLIKILPRLAKGYRAAIETRYLEGLQFEEMAQMTGKSLGCMKSQVFRGLRMCRSIVQNLD